MMIAACVNFLFHLRMNPVLQPYKILLHHKNAGVYTTASILEGGVAG